MRRFHESFVCCTLIQTAVILSLLPFPRCRLPASAPSLSAFIFTDHNARSTWGFSALATVDPPGSTAIDNLSFLRMTLSGLAVLDPPPVSQLL